MNWKWKLAQAAEIRWWRSYLSDKSPEVYLRNKRAYWRRVMQQAGIRVPVGHHVLDAGCGPAGIFTVLEQNPVDALDPLWAQYARQLPHFIQTDYPQVRFITESLENFRPENQYDLIFCLNAINHVADLDLALDNLVGCLAPQGKLWLSTDAHRYRMGQWLFQCVPADILHPHQYTLSAYQKMLTDRGLSILQTLPLKSGKIFNYYLIEAEFGG